MPGSGELTGLLVQCPCNDLKSGVRSSYEPSEVLREPGMIPHYFANKLPGFATGCVAD